MTITGYRFTSGVITPFYGAGGAAVVPDRNQLVRGAYIPGPATTGPLPGTQFAQVEAGASGRITIGEANAVFDGCEFWGQVYVIATGVTFRNCIFRGADPTSASTTIEQNNPRGIIRAYGNSRHFVLENCRIDPDAWLTQRGRTYRYVDAVGIHGGDFEARWCEIANVADGISHVAPTVTARAAQFTDIDRCWIHRAAFVNDWTGMSGGQPHADAIQAHTGKNVTIRGSMIGGIRDTAGYLDWGFDGPDNSGYLGGRPTTADGLGRNAGDDYANAALMLKQEVDDSADNRLENWTVEDNYIAGGSASLNMAYSSARPTQKFASFAVRRNRFFIRGASDGVYLWDNVLTGAGTGPYIIRSAANTLATFADNTLWDPEAGDTGAEVPFTNG